MNSGTAANTIALTNLDLAVVAVLVLVAGLVSILLRLRLEKQLAIATLRTVVQLMLVGYILKVVFRSDSPFTLLVVIAVMVTFASRAAIGRTSRSIRGATWMTFGTLLLSGILVTFSVTELVLNIDPWYQPRYIIPLLGMVIGNGMTGVSLCLDLLFETCSDKRTEIEMELALGATRWEAALEPLRQAIRRGMIPLINSMMTIGIVSLPGMMTGQILAGESPLNAVRYQIMIMFMLSASTALACIISALMVYRRLFNCRHQLRSELIKRK